MTTEPLFFFLTYAHTNQRALVERLFDDLCAEIWERTKWPNHIRPGFMDRRDIAAGADWRAAVAEALGGCRVLVPLYSPKYFNSPECGREFHGFHCRITEHHALHGGSAMPIVPALWTPVPDDQIPDVARYLHADFGAVHPAYAEDGLYMLVKNARHRGTYLRVVQNLARRIIEHAETQPMQRTEPDQVDVSRDAFRPDGERAPVPAMPLAVMVAAPTVDHLPNGRTPGFYGTEPANWAPYQPVTPRPLVDLVTLLARSHGYEPRTVTLEKGLDRRLWTEPDSGIGVVLVDPWAFFDEDLREQLRQIERIGGGRIGVLTIWNPSDEETRHRTTELLQALRSGRPGPVPGPQPAVPLTRLESELRAVLTRAVGRRLDDRPGDDGPGA